MSYVMYHKQQQEHGPAGTFTFVWHDSLMCVLCMSAATRTRPCRHIQGADPTWLTAWPGLYTHTKWTRALITAKVPYISANLLNKITMISPAFDCMASHTPHTGALTHVRAREHTHTHTHTHYRHKALHIHTHTSARRHTHTYTHRHTHTHTHTHTHHSLIYPTNLIQCIARRSLR